MMASIVVSIVIKLSARLADKSGVAEAAGRMMIISGQK
jgi:hypothetical protein